VIICDTGPRVAAALSNDDDHRRCVDLFAAMHLAGRELLVPANVVAETGYVLNHESGPRVEELFLRSLAEGDLAPVELTQVD